jgi:hypothetical protein
MNVNKDDILEALGLKEHGWGGVEWLGPALVGFGVGALIGATVALLVAPRPGVELREELLERGRRMAQRGREKASELADEVSRATEPRNY